MTRLRFILAALIVAVAVAACGGTKTVTVTHTASPTATAPPVAGTPRACVAGRSFAGCSTSGQLPDRPGVLRLAPIGGAEFPDVSDWQGHPNWSAVFAWQRAHGWPTGGFFKLGEYQEDPDAAYNAAELKGHFSAGYWFVRNTGCQHEGDLIVSTARKLGIRFVWDDVEVSEARGYASCLLSIEHSAGLGAGVYTGPGTWTGDNIPASTPLWDAAYNFSGPSYGGLWRSSGAVAWQFTDGVFAARTDVPGIGFDDVNVDLGAIKLVGGGTQPAKDPFAIMDKHVRVFHLRGGGVARGSEHGTMTTIRARGCTGKPVRLVCKSSKFHLSLLDGRLIRVGLSEHPHYSLKGAHQGGRQEIMHKQLVKLGG